jgi:hypothetical protein
MALSILGFGGLMWSWAFLEYAPGAEVGAQDGLVPAANTEAAAELMDLMVTSPIRRGMAVANLLVSGLLVVASFVLMLRRPSALWWVRQALLGNLLYTPAAMLGSIWFYAKHEAAAREIMTDLARTQGAAEAGAEPSAMGLAAGDVCLGFVMIGVYLLLWRLARREDVREFVGAA